MLCTQGYELLRVIEKERQLSVMCVVRLILLIQDLISQASLNLCSGGWL